MWRACDVVDFPRGSSLLAYLTYHASESIGSNHRQYPLITWVVSSETSPFNSLPSSRQYLPPIYHISYNSHRNKPKPNQNRRKLTSIPTLIQAINQPILILRIPSSSSAPRLASNTVVSAGAAEETTYRCVATAAACAVAAGGG
jgi:hypothetical protein